VVSIILKWKMFGTTNTLSRAGWPNWAIGEEGPWSRRWPRNQMVTLTEL
jgi:hypothetical protein